MHEDLLHGLRPPSRACVDEDERVERARDRSRWLVGSCGGPRPLTSFEELEGEVGGHSRLSLVEDRQAMAITTTIAMVEMIQTASIGLPQGLQPGLAVRPAPA